MFKEENLVVLVTGFFTFIGGILATRWKSRPSIEKTNADISQSLFSMYQSENKRLIEEINALRLEVKEIKTQFEQEAKGYKKRIQELEDEIDKKEDREKDILSELKQSNDNYAILEKENTELKLRVSALEQNNTPDSSNFS